MVEKRASQGASLGFGAGQRIGQFIFGKRDTGIELAERIQGQRACRFRTLGGLEPKVDRCIGTDGDGPKHARTVGRNHVGRQFRLRHAGQGQLQGCRIGEGGKVCRFADAKGFDQGKENLVLAARLFHQRNAELRLFVLAGQRLAENERFLPVGNVVVANLSAGERASPGVVVGKEARIGFQPHQFGVRGAARSHVEKGVDGNQVSHGGQKLDPDRHQAGPVGVPFRHPGRAQQHAAHKVSHGRRRCVHRHLRQ